MPEKVVLHWLNQSRATRILWLLEILQVPYELKVYKRDAGFRAPPELKQVHPLGRSPILQVGDKVIAESGLICQYLVKTYDTDHIVTPASANDQLDVDYYLHYSEGTLQPLLVSLLVLNTVKSRTPWLFQFIGNKVIDAAIGAYYRPELDSNLDFLETVLSKNKKPFFVADMLTAADIIMSFPLLSIFSTQSRVQIDQSKYPNIQKWCANVNANPAFVKSEELTSKL